MDRSRLSKRFEQCFCILRHAHLTILIFSKKKMIFLKVCPTTHNILCKFSNEFYLINIKTANVNNSSLCEITKFYWKQEGKHFLLTSSLTCHARYNKEERAVFNIASFFIKWIYVTYKKITSIFLCSEFVR
jgi:hypothetical protein